MSKPRFLMCICTGECPGFKNLELWKLVNYVRNQLEVEYAVVHPQLCVDDGDRFLRDLIRPGEKYVIGGCDPKMQKKMFSQAFKEAGGNFEEQAVALDLRNLSTEEAMERVRKAVEGLSGR